MLGNPPSKIPPRIDTIRSNPSICTIILSLDPFELFDVLAGLYIDSHQRVSKKSHLISCHISNSGNSIIAKHMHWISKPFVYQLGGHGHVECTLFSIAGLKPGIVCSGIVAQERMEHGGVMDGTRKERLPHWHHEPC
jgi:hypothetical protein